MLEIRSHAFRFGGRLPILLRVGGLIGQPFPARSETIITCSDVAEVQKCTLWIFSGLYLSHFDPPYFRRDYGTPLNLDIERPRSLTSALCPRR